MNLKTKAAKPVTNEHILDQNMLVPIADVGGAGPVPVPMWEGWGHSWCGYATGRAQSQMCDLWQGQL
jgi:hypothetical protein